MIFVLILISTTKITGLSLEIDMLKINKLLDTLDKKIITFLDEPDCTIRDDFIQWLEDYNCNLCQLVSYLNDDEVRAEHVARKLLHKDGPAFLKVKIDVEHLKRQLFWEEADIEEMYYNIGATKVLWFEMKNVLSHYGDRHLRNINVPWELNELDVRGRLNEDIHFTKTDDIKSKTNITCKLVYYVVWILTIRGVIAYHNYFNKSGSDELKTIYEEGTKAYEFQLDTGARRDERPDAELTYLELLDRNISRILMDPQEGQGPVLITYVKEFAEQALRVKNMMVTKTEKEDRMLTESAIKVYQRYGHPRFMSVMVTNAGEYLQNTLKLSNDLMWEFYSYRQKANGFWDDIRKIMVRDYRSDKVEAARFRNLPWPMHLQNLTDFEKEVLERSDLDSNFDLEDLLNVKSTMF